MPRVLLRPHGHLFRQGILACVAFMTPVFVVLYFLTIPRGPWLAVLATQLVATAAVTLASIAYFRLGIWVDDDGLTERGFFGLRRHIAVGDIGSIVVAETFDGTGTQTYPQLFVCDHEGRQVIRMRGQFWSRDSMNIVVRTLDVPYDPLLHTLSTSELRSDYPGLLYWFERHPALAGLAFTAATGALGAIMLLVVSALGLPLAE